MLRKLATVSFVRNNDLILSYIQLCYLGAAEENLDSGKMIKDMLLSTMQECCPASAES